MSTNVNRRSSISFFLYGYGDHRDLHSFPTRRSSDLKFAQPSIRLRSAAMSTRQALGCGATISAPIDRKSTRLNSSHEWISYAVFCLKKKKRYQHQLDQNIILKNGFLYALYDGHDRGV